MPCSDGTVVAHMLNIEDALRLVSKPGTVVPAQLVPVHCQIWVSSPPPGAVCVSPLSQTSSCPNATATPCIA